MACDHVVIGGYAAELHEVAGLPPTRDIDVCPDTDRQNLERLSRSLGELRALIRTDAIDGGLPFAHDAESLGRAEMWNLVCDAGELDLSFRPRRRRLRPPRGRRRRDRRAGSACTCGLHRRRHRLQDRRRATQGPLYPADPPPPPASAPRRGRLRQKLSVGTG